VPVSVLYYVTQTFFRRSMREVKRIYSISKSPVYAHLSETLNGLVVIRAFLSQRKFIAMFESKLDLQTIAVFKINLLNRWLGLRLDWTGALLVGVTAVVAVATAGSVSPSLIGLALSYSLSITNQLNWLVRGSTEVETHLASVERVENYSNLPEERPALTATRPAPDWPARGALEFKNVTV
jgi:ATP-binding cassette subfamily C (CFTR/MRP) protein 1